MLVYSIFLQHTSHNIGIPFESSMDMLLYGFTYIFLNNVKAQLIKPQIESQINN